MVSQIIGLILGGLLAAPSTLDLTPLPHRSPQEGNTYPDIAFQNGDYQVIYLPPPDWKISGSPKRATVRAKDFDAEGTISSHLKPAQETFDEDTIKALKAELVSSLPKEAAKLEWGADEVNAMRMNRHDTLRLILTYSAFSQRFTTTIIYCNFANEQIRFQFTARDTEFQKAFIPFRESILTFRRLE